MAFVDDMANDPLGTHLIKGVFLHGRGNVLFVMEKAKYDPTEKGKSIRMINAIFRYGYIVLFLLEFGATDSSQKFEWGIMRLLTGVGSCVAALSK
jgi:hypothetical protein